MLHLISIFNRSNYLSLISVNLTVAYAKYYPGLI
jgi:hypothetical protein